MAQYLKDEHGKFAGSIGYGRDSVPTPRLLVVQMSHKQAESLQSLAHTLHTLRMHPDYAEAVDMLVNAADHCTLCGARMGYGVVHNATVDGEIAHVCNQCLDTNNELSVICDVCDRYTNNYYIEKQWRQEQWEGSAQWPTDATHVCLACVNPLD